MKTINLIEYKKESKKIRSGICVSTAMLIIFSIISIKLLPEILIVEHVLATVFGVFLMILNANIDCAVWKKITPYIAVISVVLLCTFKSTQLYSLSILLLNAYIVERFQKSTEKLSLFCFITCIEVVLLYNIGVVNSLGLCIILVSIIVGGYLSVRKECYLTIITILTILIVRKAYEWIMIFKDNYYSRKILAWLSPEAYSQTEGYYILLAKEILKKSVFWGKGEYESILSSQGVDHIFLTITGEWGYLTSGILILSFATLFFWIYKAFVLFRNNSNHFITIFTLEIVVYLFITTALNVLMCCNVLPDIAAIRLPLISTWNSFAMIGIVLSLLRDVEKKKEIQICGGISKRWRRELKSITKG